MGGRGLVLGPLSPRVLSPDAAKSTMGLIGREVSGGCDIRGVFEWVLRWGRGVDPDSEVQARFPAVAVEVVGLWGGDGSRDLVHQ